MISKEKRCDWLYIIKRLKTKSLLWKEKLYYTETTQGKNKLNLEWGWGGVGAVQNVIDSCLKTSEHGDKGRQ